MTEYAVPGEPHGTLPAGLAVETTLPGYAVLPWLCPTCDQLVAESVAEPDGRLRTVIVGVSPVRRRDADEGGVPFYGRSRREMRGKGQRRATARLQSESFARLRRAGIDAAGDYSPIEVREFDTLCENCPRRLRIRLPSA